MRNCLVVAPLRQQQRRLTTLKMKLSIPAAGILTATVPLFQHQHPHYHSFTKIRHTEQSHSIRIKGSSSNRRSSSLSASSSSSFNPPLPPSFKGEPIFPNILLSQTNNPNLQSHIRNSDPDAIFVVTGSNRGIGLQYVKTLLQRTQGTIVACCRDVERATALREIQASFGESSRVDIVPLDVTDASQIEALGEVLEERYARVDALFNVAGVLGDGQTTSGPERSLSRIDPEWLRMTFDVNVIGPTLLSRRLAPLMKTTTSSRRRKGSSETSPPPPPRATSIIVNMSARVGSISDNSLGGWYSYRASKSALNQMTRTMAHELKRQGTWVLSLHPGTTDTDLSKPFQKNVRPEKLFPVEFTVGRMCDVVEGMEERHTGGFYDWAGMALPF